MKHLSPKSNTVMKYLGTDEEYHYADANDVFVSFLSFLYD